MKVAVTGGTGFLGSHVVEVLQRRGHEPKCMVRPTSDIRHLQRIGARTVQATLDDPASLSRFVQGSDAVVHLAGLVKARNREEFNTVNGDGTRRLAEAAIAAGVDRFTLVSSVAAKGPSPTSRPLPARPATRPVSHYGASKALGEAAVMERADRLDVRVVRPPVVYGPRDTELLRMFKAVRRGVFPLLGPRGALLSTIYGPDCADCIVAATETDQHGPFIVEPADGPGHTWTDFRDAVAAAMHRHRLLTVRVPTPVVSAVASMSQAIASLRGKATVVGRDKVREMRHQYWLVDHASATKRLDWTAATDLEEGTRRTVDWYRSQGWL